MYYDAETKIDSVTISGTVNLVRGKCHGIDKIKINGTLLDDILKDLIRDAVEQDEDYNRFFGDSQCPN